MSQEIRLHDQQDNNQSVLTHVLSYVWDGGSGKSLEHLRSVQSGLDAAQRSGDNAAVAALKQQANAAVADDQKALQSEGTVLGYAAGGLQTMGLFLGRGGMATTAGVYALNNMKWGSSLEDKAADGLLGAAKGVALRQTFKYVGEKKWGAIEQGVSIGFLSRLSDVGLNRDTWKDGVANGIGTTLSQAGDWRALATDGLTFGVAKGLLGIAGGRLEQSVVGKTMATGGAFGFTTGATNEIARQSKNNESFDLSKVLGAGLTQGGIDSIAAIPGGLQGARAASLQREQSSRIMSDTTSSTGLRTGGGGDAIATAEGLKGSVAAPRQFVVTDGQEALNRFMEGGTDRTSAMLRVREILNRQQGAPLATEQTLFLQHLTSPAELSRAAAGADLAAYCNADTVDPAARNNHVLPDAQGPIRLSADADGKRISFTAGDTTAPGYERSIQLGYLTGEGNGDAAQRELIQWVHKENGPDNPLISPEMRPVRNLRAHLQETLKTGNWVLVASGKNSAADKVGMDYILANREDGRYFFFDPTLDPDSKTGVSALRARAVVNMDLEENSVDLTTRINFMQQVLAATTESSPLNMREIKPPSIDGGKTDAEKQADIARFRQDIAKKITALNAQAAQADQPTSVALLRQAELLHDYDMDVASAQKQTNRSASETADPEYPKRVKAFNDVFDTEVRDLVRGIIRGNGRITGGTNIDAESLRRTGMRLDRQYDQLSMVAKGQKFVIDRVSSRIASVVNDLVNSQKTIDFALKRQLLAGQTVDTIKTALINRLSHFSPSELFGEPEAPQPQRGTGRGQQHRGQQYRGPRW